MCPSCILSARLFQIGTCTADCCFTLAGHGQPPTPAFAHGLCRGCYDDYLTRVHARLPLLDAPVVMLLLCTPQLCVCSYAESLNNCKPASRKHSKFKISHVSAVWGRSWRRRPAGIHQGAEKGGRRSCEAPGEGTGHVNAIPHEGSQRLWSLCVSLPLWRGRHNHCTCLRMS